MSALRTKGARLPLKCLPELAIGDTVLVLADDSDMPRARAVIVGETSSGAGEPLRPVVRLTSGSQRGALVRVRHKSALQRLYLD